MSQDWYWRNQGGQQFGPVTRDELLKCFASGQVQQVDFVWSQGMANWMPMNQVEGLIPPPDPRFPSPPPPPPPPPQSTFANSYHAPQQESRIQPSNPPKDPVLMAVLSGCCIAGLGQIVLGQGVKGIVILLGSMVLAAITFGVTIIITWPLGAIDAYLIAKKLKEGKSVGTWEFF